MPLFCPSSHLMLSAAQCPVCGWKKPAPAQLGQAAWPSVQLRAGLGGPGRHVFARLAAAQGMLALPLNNRELVGLQLADGRERWRVPLGEGLVARQLLSLEGEFLLTISDERPIGQAGPAQLASLDPGSGKLTVRWQAPGHQLSGLACDPQRLFARTSSSELVAFRHVPGLAPDWRVPLNTFWPLSPHLAAGKVFVSDGRAMQGEGWLLAFDAPTGQKCWTQPIDGMLSHPMASHHETLIFQNGKKQILALDAHSGALRWSLKASQLYTPPVTGGGRVYFVARGEVLKGEPGYYLLNCLDALSGEPVWEAPLPERVIIPPTWAEGCIYLAGEKGQVLAFGADGAEVFRQQAGAEENPPRTELLLAEGLLLVGTYAGDLFAFQAQEAPQELPAPEDCLQSGDFLGAAEAYALRGDFQPAADLYAQKLNDLDKALALYEHAGLYQQAADLCAAHERLSEAQRYYEQAGNLPAQAEILLKRGDELSAARIFEQLGQKARAAQLFEQAGELNQARKLYQQLGDINSVIRLFQVMKPSSLDIDLLVEHKKLPEAAEAAMKAGLWRKAVDLFNQLSMPERELDALHQLKQQEPEEWVFQRIADLARKSGRFVEEAQAWEALGKVRRTAEACQRAAMQAEQGQQTGLAADLYEKAASYFGDCGEEDMEAKCGESVARLREIPIVQIKGSTTKEFKENQWNTLELRIHNRGYGVAREVRWSVHQEHFDVDQETGTWLYKQLAIAATRAVTMHIRPRPGEKGEAVPFAIDWAWESVDGQVFRERISISVPVKGEHDSRATSQPVIIQSGAMYVQTDKYVAGDDISGGQKGDRVEIKRGTTGGLKLTADETQVRTSRMAQSGKNCPVCGLANDADAKICNYCGNPLPA